MALTEKGIQQVQALVTKYGARETAKKLIDNFIGRQLGGMSSSDLSDTAIFANGLDEAEDMLNNGDYQGAFTIAKETANEMLEDEGMGMGMDMDENLNELSPELRYRAYNKAIKISKDISDTDPFGHNYRNKQAANFSTHINSDIKDEAKKIGAMLNPNYRVDVKKNLFDDSSDDYRSRVRIAMLPSTQPFYNDAPLHILIYKNDYKFLKQSMNIPDNVQRRLINLIKKSSKLPI